MTQDDQFKPDASEFAALWGQGKGQLVTLTLPADLDTPVSLLMRLAPPGTPYSFMFESVTGGEVRGRYSVVGFAPDLIWRYQDGVVSINRDAQHNDSFETDNSPALDSLRSLLAECRLEVPPQIPAIAAGLFGYLGYDMVRLVEDLPQTNPDPLALPDSIMMRPGLVAVLDGVRGEVTICVPAWPKDGVDAKTAREDAIRRIEQALALLETTPVRKSSPSRSENLQLEAKSNFTKAAYMAAVETARDYIRKGDIFQVVPAQRWSIDYDLPPFALYRSLRRTNPSPFMFYLDMKDFHIVGASPEILVRLRDGEVTIRPIAGTRPRGRDDAHDRALEADLLADPKERAEHLMLLDLGRNDVGRVAKTGTIRPTEEFIIERYSHVMHIVSNVVGELREGEDALSALLSGLPAGTVSGAPKIRAMQIIDELEPEKRGVYGGGVGYFAANGEMDMCIALRTAVIKNKILYIQAGGGVVHDSDAEAEFEETLNKSRALMRAAETSTDFL